MDEHCVAVQGGSKGFSIVDNPFETRKDRKEVFMTTSANYEHLNT